MPGEAVEGALRAGVLSVVGGTIGAVVSAETDGISVGSRVKKAVISGRALLTAGLPFLLLVCTSQAAHW